MKRRCGSRARGLLVSIDARIGAALPEAGIHLADLPAILAAIGDVPYQWHLDTDKLAWGENVHQVLTVPRGENIATGGGFARLLLADNTVTRFEVVARSQARDPGDGVPYQLQYCVRAGADGTSTHWVEDIGRWFAGPDGRPSLARGVVRLVDERHAREERLAHLSRFDELTGEMNRAHLTETLATALDEAIRYRSSCGLLVVAIDNLGRINETYGFAVADQVILAMARNIRARMRGGDALGRLSGNKFGIVLKNCTPDDMAAAAERMLATARDAFVATAAGTVVVTATIGGVVAPRHARTVNDILSRAQESLEDAKAKRRGSYQAYRPSNERDALRRENARATEEIVAALNERRILIAFEPVVELASRRIAFHECLLRIRRPDGTLLAADAAIPIAERLGLVRLIDRRMIELTMAELHAMPDLRASLNVSADSACDADWWASLVGHLRAQPDAGCRLTLEITESAAIHNVEDMRGFVVRAKDLGCRIAIDDFGAGHTSFRSLRRLGVDIVKIDGAFVRDLTRSADDQVFVRTMVELGRGLGLSTVAEWVQDETAATMLAAFGCDHVQGALVGLASLERPHPTLRATAPEATSM
jgi:diguanylate cyclase (GGDEF)-like protein